MGKLLATKERQKRFGKGQQPLIKCLERGFAGNRIANEHHDKIDQIIGPKACSGKTHLLLNGFQKTSMREHLSPRPLLLPTRKGQRGQILERSEC